MRPSSSAYLDVNGLGLYYEVYESAAKGALLLLHGFSGTGRTHWHRQIPALSRYYTVVVPDLRAHGKSRCTDIPRDYWELAAADITSLIVHLGLGQAHVCGFSLGSLIAQFLAMEHPELVKSLVLVSTLGCIPMEPGRGLLGLIESLADPERVSTRWKEQLDAMHGPQEWRTMFRNYGRSILTRLEETQGVITAPRLGELACPTLIVQGEQDTLNPPSLGSAVHDAIAGSRLVLLQGGHRVHEVDPNRFNRVVLDFLAGEDGQAPGD